MINKLENLLKEATFKEVEYAAIEFLIKLEKEKISVKQMIAEKLKAAIKVSEDENKIKTKAKKKGR